MALTDFHAHMAPTVEAKARLLQTMKSLGITRAVVVAGGLVKPEALSSQISNGGGNDIPAPNDAVWELCTEEKGVLFPFFFANPHQPPTEYAAKGEKFFGLKLGPAVHGIALDDERTVEYIIQAAKFQHPVYLHCLSRPGFDIEALVLLANTFPTVTFILGHAGIGNCDFYAVDRIQPYSNIHFETSGGFSSVIKFAINKLGSRRILFGSEYPLQDPSLELLKAKVTGMSDDSLNTNACHLLGLESP